MVRTIASRPFRDEPGGWNWFTGPNRCYLLITTSDAPVSNSFLLLLVRHLLLEVMHLFLVA